MDKKAKFASRELCFGYFLINYLVASATAAAWRRGRGAVFLGFGAALEVGGVPTAALELETGGRQLLGKGLLAAFRTSVKRRFAHFLHDFFFNAATGAAVIVN